MLSMQYTNKDIRRQDRLLNENVAVRLLQGGEYGVLSMQAEKGGGYGLPISYVWDGEQAIYLHCALEGRKIALLKLNSEVSFCVVGNTNVIPNEFTTEYQSVVIECKASLDLQIEEKTKALRLLIEKYSPNDIEIGMKYISKSFDRTQVIKLSVGNWSGKSKLMKNS